MNTRGGPSGGTRADGSHVCRGSWRNSGLRRTAAKEREFKQDNDTKRKLASPFSGPLTIPVFTMREPSKILVVFAAEEKKGKGIDCVHGEENESLAGGF